MKKSITVFSYRANINFYLNCDLDLHRTGFSYEFCTSANTIYLDWARAVTQELWSIWKVYHVVQGVLLAVQ